MLSNVTVYVVVERGRTEFPLLSLSFSESLGLFSDGVVVGAEDESEEECGLVGFWGAVVPDGESEVPGVVEGADGVVEVFGVAVSEDCVAGFVDGLCEFTVLEEVRGFCLST